MNIAELDKNLSVQHSLPQEVKESFEFFDAEQAPFSIHGVFRDGDCLVRVPEAVAETVSEGVLHLSRCTAGGKVRFRTDSRRVAVIAVCPENDGMPHFAYTGVCGFDVYADFNEKQRYFGTVIPPLHFKGGFEGVVNLKTSEMRTVTVNMPLYNGVQKLYIGVEKGASLQAAAPYTAPPVVYYGSSITQGGCASRPGSCYENIIHTKWDVDHINLGFSGNARAEDTMMAYIASLPMSVFVYDYDYNAFDSEYYAKTHYKGYLTVREKHPDLPIVMLTRPRRHMDEESLTRIRIARETYDKAKAAGDEHVYFLTGPELIDEDLAEHCLVDDCHPTDLGFYSMAKKLLPVLQEVYSPYGE